MGVHLGSTLPPRLWQGARHNFNWGLPCTSLAHVSRSSQRPAPLLFCPFRLSPRVRSRSWTASSAGLRRPASKPARAAAGAARRRSPCRYRAPAAPGTRVRRPRRGCLAPSRPRPASPRRSARRCQRPRHPARRPRPRPARRRLRAPRRADGRRRVGPGRGPHRSAKSRRRVAQGTKGGSDRQGDGGSKAHVPPAMREARRPRARPANTDAALEAPSG